MMDYFRGLPFPFTVAVLLIIVLVRGGATYALGRGAQAGARHTRLRTVLESPRFERAQALVDRWGAPIIALSFLTVGFQTLANVAAGVARMPLRRYVPALIVGGVAWALLYATLGVVGFAGFSELWALSPAAAIVAVAGIVLALTGFVVHRLRSRHRRREPDDHRFDPSSEQTADRLAARDRLA